MERLTKYLAGTAIVAALTFSAPFTALAGHWCGSVWSDFPCADGGWYGAAPSYQNPYYYTNNYSYNQYQYPQNQYSYYPYNYYQYQTPQCSITYSTNGNYSLGYGYPVTLTWSSQGASSAYLSSTAGTVPLTGSMIVYPTQISTYTLTINGPFGSRSCSTTYNPAYYGQNYYYPQSNYPYYNSYPYNYGNGYPYTYR